MQVSFQGCFDIHCVQQVQAILIVGFDSFLAQPGNSYLIIYISDGSNLLSRFIACEACGNVDN